MAENKALNEEALVEMAHTMGFDLAHACAAAADAFARGVADGFAAYRKSWPPKTAALSWYTMEKTKNRS